MSKVAYDYEMECVNPSDYRLVFEFKTTNRLIKYIFQKSKKAVGKKLNTTISGDLEDVESFKVLPEYLKLIKTFMRKLVLERKREFLVDGIDIIDHDVIDCLFMKESGGDWKIKVVVGGVYADKR